MFGIDSHALALDLTLINNAVFIPSERSRDLLTFLPLAALALDDLGDPSSGDGLSLQDRRGVQSTGVRVSVHPGPLSGVVGEVGGLDEHLAILELGQVLRLEGKGGRGDGSSRGLSEDPDSGGGRSG